ncbi:MAG: hypothetical protein MUO40_13970 [Anaerolineaceae bacterium]|nr:hypothetical protein [Anaerolineaceae bacterium]
MKLINKEALKQLIDDLVIEDIHITETLDTPIDASTLDGKHHLLNYNGPVKITILGRVPKPGEQL